MKKLFTVAIVVLIQLSASAQDPFFTQAFNAPLTLNPATAGTGEMDLRFTSTYKRHWINVPTNMEYAAVGADRFIKSFHGLGRSVGRKQHALNDARAVSQLQKLHFAA